MTYLSHTHTVYYLPQVEPILHPGASLQWSRCADLPVGMAHAQAVLLKNKVYVGGGTTQDYATEATLCIYTPTTDTWATLPSPVIQSALTTYNSQLVLVGGVVASTSEITNQLWALQEDERSWGQPLPAMLTARRGASAISHHDHLIVTGGRDSNNRETTVEVWDGNQWINAEPLPKISTFMKTTVHNDTYYLMGGDGQCKSVFCASLQSLIAKTTQQSPSSSGQQSEWETLPDVPYVFSATTVLGAALVAVGGKDGSKTPRSSLYMYSLPTRSWLHVGNVPLAVSSTGTITLPTGEMIMFGGVTKRIWASCTVYKASLRT